MNRKTGIVFLLIYVFMSVCMGDVDAATQTKRPSPTPTERPLPALAPESGINVTLSPTFINLVADPGEEVESQMKITNNNNYTEYFRIDVSKFEPTDDGERPRITDMSENDTYKDWVEFENDVFEVGANETKTINFTITPSKEASLGYYYAFLINRRAINEAKEGATVSGTPALLTLLEVRSKNAQRELQISEFKTDKLFYEYLPAQFDISVKNTGNIHIAPSGDIFIDSMSNRSIGTIRINPARGNVLPNTMRTYTAEWTDGFPVRQKIVENGDSKQKTIYDFTQAHKFRVGKYTANIVLVYDNGERDVPIEATVSFWVIPWKILGGGALIILFTLLGIKNTLYLPIKKLLRK